MWREAINKIRNFSLRSSVQKYQQEGGKAVKKFAGRLPKGSQVRQDLERRWKAPQEKLAGKWQGWRADMAQRATMLQNKFVFPDIRGRVGSLGRRVVSLAPALPEVSKQLPSFRQFRNLVLGLAFLTAFGFGLGKGVPPALAKVYVESAKAREPAAKEEAQHEERQEIGSKPNSNSLIREFES